MSALLVIPQWQGYSADDRPRRGALAIAAALAPQVPDHVIAVPDWHALAAIPGGGGDVFGLDEIADQALAARRWLEAAQPARLLALGGDCGSDLAMIGWQAERSGTDLGLLYLDAHADLNTPASSPSGRFHGMVLRAALGDGPAPLRALCPRPLAVEQVILAGLRDLDPPERDFLDATGLTHAPAEAISDGRVAALIRAHPARRWHVHFDLDVVDPADLPEVTVPTPGGPPLAALARLLVELVTHHDVASLTVTEHVGGAASARRIADLLADLRRTGWR